MKCIIYSLLILLSAFSACSRKDFASSSSKTVQVASDNDFTLSYNVVGFGSNRFSRQPVFKVSKSKFVYTSEDAWFLKGHKPGRDFICMGDFKASAIDSIKQLIMGIQDTLVERYNPYIMSGSATCISISNNSKKVRFDLHNAGDSIATRIIAILNSHIPRDYEKLYAGINGNYTNIK